MLPRLYFVLPDINSTTKILNERHQADSEPRRLAVASCAAENLPIHGIQLRDGVHDRDDNIQRALGNLNLGVFAVAALTLA